MNLREALQILYLPNKTTLREAKSAYRRLAKEYHPDVSSEESATRFIEIISAFEYIKDYVANKKGTKYKTKSYTTNSYSKGVETPRIDTTGMIIADRSPSDARHNVYNAKFGDFINKFDNVLDRSIEIFNFESERFCNRVYDSIIRHIETYSSASEVRNKLHKDINNILTDEATKFLNKLTDGPKRVIKEYDNWLAEMRSIAIKHMIPKSLNEYLSSTSGLILTFAFLTILLPSSIIAAASLPYSYLLGIIFLIISTVVSLWGSKSIYCWYCLKSARDNTTRFLSESGLQRVDQGVLPISKEKTREERANEGGLTGGLMGWFIMGPWAGIAGAIIGSILGGMSGKKFEEYLIEVADNTLDAVSGVLEKFLDETGDRLVNERQPLINQMRKNFIKNLRDERMSYGL